MISNKIKMLSTDDLRSRAGKIATYSRKIDVLFLEHIAELERRKAYLNWGFKSFYDFIVTEYKMSGASAYRRMQAAYALLVVPEIKTEIESGALNLSQISLAHKAIKQEQKINGPVQIQERKQIFNDIRNKTARETEKILDQKLESFSPAVQPTERHRHDDSVDLNLRLPKEVYAKLMRIKELYSHSIPSGNWVAVIDKMADDVLAKRDPLKKRSVVSVLQDKQKKPDENSVAERNQNISGEIAQIEPKQNISNDIAKTETNQNITSETARTELEEKITSEIAGKAPNQMNEAVRAEHSKNISGEIAQGRTEVKTVSRPLRPTVRRYIFQRDQVCQQKLASGKICGSRFQLEIDHIHPRFAGGLDQITNLRLLCQAHNQTRYRTGR